MPACTGTVEAVAEKTAEEAPHADRGAEPEAPPAGAIEGPVSDFGVPFDPRDEPYPGPQAIFPSGIPRIVAVPNPDGSLDVAWLDTGSPQIVLTHVVPGDDAEDGGEGGYRAAWHLPLPTLDRLGGYARDAEGSRYVLTTLDEDAIQHSETPRGEHRDGIARLVKIAPDGSERFVVDLRTDLPGAAFDPLVGPMSFGSGRIAVGGAEVGLTLSCLTEYDPGVSSRHQRQCFFVADARTGELLAHVPGPGHSFEHRLLFDRERFVGLIHGDAALRGIGLAAFGAALPFADRVAFAVKGGDDTTGGAYQNTFTRVGQVVAARRGYALAFATERDPRYRGEAVIASRNLAFVHVRADFESVAAGADRYDVRIVDTAEENDAAEDFDVEITDYWGGEYEGRNRGVVWLTRYDDRETDHVESPKLVGLPDGTLIALWERWTLDAPAGLWGMALDEYGHVEREARSLGEGRLYRADDAIALGDRAAWVVGDSRRPQLVLYTVDASLAIERYELP